MPFLTDIDPRGAVRGSRDPLGAQAIWTRLGRQVVGNLTTVSASVRDFTVTLLGYYFADRVAEERGASDDLGVFLRWEQLAGYARGGGNGDWVFRGVERARKNWNESDVFRLGVAPALLILSDQKTYGLWGLYTVPSRSSGLVEGSPTRLTPEARRFVEENYLPGLGAEGARGATKLTELLAKDGAKVEAKGRDQELFAAVARVLRKRYSDAEKAFYRRHLVEGGPADSTQGGQRLLADAMRESIETTDWAWSPAAVNHLAKRCRAETGEPGKRVAEGLDRIREAERLLAPSASLFAFLLRHGDATLESVETRVRKAWGAGLRTVNPEPLRAIEPELGGGGSDAEAARGWIEIAEALAAGEYGTAIRGLLEQNRRVMAQRGGAAPWAELRGGRLHVRFEAEVENLPARDELPALWRHSYFLDPLRTVIQELEG